MSEPIFVYLVGNTPKFFELTVQSIKFLKKSIPTANVGIITPAGVEDMRGAIEDRLKELDPRVDTSNFNFVEGKKHFDDWNNTQFLLDIESYAAKYDPIVFIDSDTVILREVLSYVQTFKESGKKFAFLNDHVNEYPNFKANWGEEDRQFIPQTTFMIFRSSAVPEFFSIWKDTWNEWITPAPFIQHKDPARFFNLSRLQICTYSLSKSIFKYVKNFDNEVSVITRKDLKICRNLGIEPQKTKKIFLSAGSSYSNDGASKVTVTVQNGKINSEDEEEDEAGGTSGGEKKTVNPFVNVKVGDWEKHTNVLKDTLNPAWDEQFVFDNSTYAEANAVGFELINKSTNAPIGSGSLSLLDDKVSESSDPPAIHYTVPLKDKDGNEKAVLEVNAEFYVKQEPVEDEGVVKSRAYVQGGLKITLTSAKDFEAKSNPFIKLIFNKQTFKTKGVANSKEPAWNESFQFTVDTPDLEHGVIFQAWGDKGDEDFIGNGTLIDLGSYIGANDKDNDIPLYSHNQKNVGSLLVKITYAGPPPA